MSDTPKRIWAWNPDNYMKKVGFETQSGNEETTEYIRADIHEAKIKDLEEEVRDLGTWFDRRELAHKAIDEEVINAAKGYLRVCRSGGMDPDESSLVLAAIEEMARLSVFADVFSRVQSNNDTKRIKELEAQLAESVNALRWCAGSADFNEGGVSYEGWNKICAPIAYPLAEED